MLALYLVNQVSRLCNAIMTLPSRPNLGQHCIEVFVYVLVYVLDFHVACGATHLRLRHLRFFDHVQPSSWPCFCLNFDLGSSPLNSMKKSTRSEIMVVECSCLLIPPCCVLTVMCRYACTGSWSMLSAVRLSRLVASSSSRRSKCCPPANLGLQHFSSDHDIWYRLKIKVFLKKTSCLTSWGHANNV